MAKCVAVRSIWQSLFFNETVGYNWPNLDSGGYPGSGGRRVSAEGWSMARPLVTLSVELSDEVLLRLLSAGGVAPTSELRTKIGQSIANAGAEFLLGVITRNQSDDEEIATSLATVRAALRQVIAAVGREDDTAPLTNGAKSKTAAAIRQLLDVRQRVRGALRAEAKVAAGDKTTGDPAVRGGGRRGGG